MSCIFGIVLDPIPPFRVRRERGRIAVPSDLDRWKTRLEIIEKTFCPRAITASVGNEQIRHNVPRSLKCPSADQLTHAIPERRNKAVRKLNPVRSSVT